MLKHWPTAEPSPGRVPALELVTDHGVLGYVDFDASGYEFRACRECTVRRPQFTRQDSGMPIVREWHDPYCPALLEWE